MEATAYPTTYVMYLRGKRFLGEFWIQDVISKDLQELEKTLCACCVKFVLRVVLVGRCVCTRRQTSPSHTIKEAFMWVRSRAAKAQMLKCVGKAPIARGSCGNHEPTAV